jgi:Uma2 family endonuclease
MAGGDPMKPAGPGVKLTYDDFVLFPEDGKRHELIDGEHCVTPSPNLRHEQISGDLFGFLWRHLEAHPIGRVFHGRTDVVLSNFDVFVPDLLYVSNETAARVLTDKHVRGAPDLVGDVGSPSTRKRDETIKRRLYERSGVTEYWFVDPEVDVVRIYRNEGGRFSPVVELSRESGDVLTTPLLPGFELALARLFRE